MKNQCILFYEHMKKTTKYNNNTFITIKCNICNSLKPCNGWYHVYNKQFYCTKKCFNLRN